MEIDIGLDKPDATWAAGDRLTGDVRVVVDHDIESVSIRLVLGVECTSVTDSPNDDPRRQYLDDRQQTLLHQGPMAAGAHSLPFQVEVPAGPYSYDGQTIRLGWYVRAMLEPENGTAVSSASIPVTVVPGAAAAPDAPGTAAERVTFAEAPKGSVGCLAFALLMLAAGIAGVWIGTRRDAPGAAGFSLLVAGLGVVLILVNVYQYLVARRFQSAEAWIESRLVRPGERVSCGLTFQVSRPAEIESAGITLVARESVRVKRGYSSTGLGSDRVLHEERFEFPLPSRQVPARVPVSVRGELAIPAGAPLSFDEVKDFGGGMALTWTAEFSVKVRNWPDWVHRETILVVPPGRG